MRLKLTTYYQWKCIPDFPEKDVFHSKEMFLVYESTPGYKPILIIATDNGDPIARLFCTIHKTKKWIPAFLSNQCIIYGTNDFLDQTGLIDSESVFGEMLEHLTREVCSKCFFIEFRNLSNSLFGYKYFRKNGYFPINWMRVRNSLHSIKNVEERYSSSRIRQIKKGLENGATVKIAETYEEIHGFARMLKRNYSSHIRKTFPNKIFFQQINEILVKSGRAKIFIVKYKEKIIGGSVCSYSGENASLWYSGGMHTTYAHQYPGVLAVWGAMKDAHRCGYRHIEFMDVGLPFQKNGYRNFVTLFGGKLSSTRRWFKFRWRWLNKLLIAAYV
ncbi:MAG: GNAT family N-acetyltransferase [Bacteroidaceae bacterium]